ncbi:sugar ABC transporter substrate-binding protein [Aidingimonas halophila]|uniref:Monosaccharide ABC transporter substrate-binding protein, CUT2 family n=1 Tax=Aidingimonas halophila TaxID=574349 RepID=A0A1H2ZE50_9GAMM|nr:sugar ABC transporter substrate-binding protein [Aidingimonas halophila]GHC15791.1 sugar ABC transporter substrate-binding protein [Aidingimonas halophila]SDX15238.1 monosaccharide ABC transporter substrate-binding protein, CUT2 family [Aidingimonas halophila]
MNKTLKLTTGLLVGSLALAINNTTFAQDDEDNQMEIIAITHIVAADPFGNVLKRGFENAGEAMDVDVRYRSPAQYDTAKMQQMIEQAVASKPDGIALTIPDPSAFEEPIQDAIDSGIPVVALNSGGEVSGELGTEAYVGQSEYESGYQAGERMREAGVENPVCVNFAPGQIQLDQRCSGFDDAFDGESEQLSTTQDPIEIRNAVFAYLNSNSDTDGVLSLGSLSTVPLLKAFREEGALDQITFATFDLAPETLEAVRDGEMLFAIDQQQYLQGFLPIVMLSLYDRYGLMPTTDIQTGPNFVTEKNAERVIELTEKGYR